MPGAGALEVAIYHALQKFKETVKGRARLGVQAYAEALLIIPKVLAQNSGLDPQETMVKLLEEYAESGQPVGVDISTGESHTVKMMMMVVMMIMMMIMMVIIMVMMMIMKMMTMMMMMIMMVKMIIIMMKMMIMKMTIMMMLMWMMVMTMMMLVLMVINVNDYVNGDVDDLMMMMMNEN